MDNNKILQERWKEVDKKLTAFYNKNKQLNKEMLNNIQQIFEGIDTTYEELFNYAEKKYQRILRTKVNELKKEVNLDGYVAYILNEYTTKSKLRYSEYLTGLFIIEYYKRDLERNKAEQVLFEEVAEITYIEAQKEVIGDRPRKKLKNIIPEVFLLQLIGASKYNNAFWGDYKQGSISYNAEQLFKLVAVNMQSERPLDVNADDFKKLFEKQDRNYLAKKKNIEPSNEYQDEYYGPLDDIMVYIANQMALRGMEDQGCKKVQFIATMDEKTTEMCSSLNGQIFSIKGWNKYYRYSDIDKKDILYTTKGLKVGENLPPISNSIHRCRSTIYPIRED